ncbi:hypothetical protein RGUI_3657 [Rhodovulum sp. P5]|nr:hypothetical protein RGUI_3657 [Rhodovulum sp. P5]
MELQAVRNLEEIAVRYPAAADMPRLGVGLPFVAPEMLLADDMASGLGICVRPVGPGMCDRLPVVAIDDAALIPPHRTRPQIAGWLADPAQTDADGPSVGYMAAVSGPFGPLSGGEGEWSGDPAWLEGADASGGAPYRPGAGTLPDVSGPSKPFVVARHSGSGTAPQGVVSSGLSNDGGSAPLDPGPEVVETVLETQQPEVVPLPQALPLMLTALVGIGLVRRRRRA